MLNSEQMFQGFSSVQVKQLKESAALAFQVLEPWFHAQPTEGAASFPEIHTLISGIRMQGIEFVRAIDRSLEAGQCAVNFAFDLNVIWEGIVSGADQGDIAANINALRCYAHEAHEASEKTLDHFQSVRKNIHELSRTIPLTGELLLLKMEKVSRSERRHAMAAKMAFKAAMLIHEAALVSASAPSPILMIVMPIALPILELVTRRLGDMEVERASERRMEQVSLEAVAQQLEKANDDLASVLDHLRGFTIWWSSAEDALDALSARMNATHLTEEEILLSSKRHADDLSRQFGEYLSEICKLKDMHFYPRDYGVYQQPTGIVQAHNGFKLSPEKVLSLMSEEFIEWEGSLSKLRRAIDSINRRDIHQTHTRLQDMKEAMRMEFSLHNSLLRSLLGQLSNYPTAKGDNMADGTKHLAVSCLEKHIAVSRLMASHIPGMKSYLSRYMSRRPRSYRRFTTGSLEVTSVEADLLPKDTSFLQSCMLSYSDAKSVLRRLESCMETVGALYTILACVDYSQIMIKRYAVEDAMAAYSHLH